MGDAGGGVLGDAQASFNPAQCQHAAVGGYLAASELAMMSLPLAGYRRANAGIAPSLVAAASGKDEVQATRPDPMVGPEFAPYSSLSTNNPGEFLYCDGSDRKVMVKPEADISAVQENAAEAARLLSLLANERRLLLLCYLVGEGEMTVTSLAATLGLSQPALSQHLAKLRADGLVATRKSSQTVFYRLADPKAARLLEVLRELYCPPEMPIALAAVEQTEA